MSRLGGFRSKIMQASSQPWVADPVTPRTGAGKWARPPLGQSLGAEYLPVNGRQTEVFRVPATTDKPKMHVLVVPGNPGQGAYYNRYMEHLSELMHGEVEIWSMTHKGFELDEVNPDEPVEASALKEQVNHLVAFLNEHLIGDQKPPIALIGHSIGAYICVKAAERLECSTFVPEPKHPISNIAKVISLYPFFQTDFSVPKQAFLRRATALYAWLAMAGAMLGALPRLVQNILLNLFASDLEPQAVEPTLALLMRRTTRAALYMGSTEFRDLSRPFDWQLIGRLGNRATVHCAPRDHWFPDAQWDDMNAALPNTQMFWEDNQRHGFCVSEELSRDAARRSAIQLRQALADVSVYITAQT